MKRTLLLSILLAGPLLALQPPSKGDDPRVLELCASNIKGDGPFRYQWYRGTATNPLAYKIPAPEGIQQFITFERATAKAGLYRCVVSNDAGSYTTEPTKISRTSSSTATPLAATIKTP